ncbi:hypothetical protein Syun_013869 [Stephania yunnanensis]|uniref:Uncharacterized protein n=1 Tax=Stephania yunnanensis TaxID=152371 RepID=A0AAP0JIN6_9MAGN
MAASLLLLVSYHLNRDSRKPNCYNEAIALRVEAKGEPTRRRGVNPSPAGPSILGPGGPKVKEFAGLTGSNEKGKPSMGPPPIPKGVFQGIQENELGRHCLLIPLSSFIDSTLSPEEQIAIYKSLNEEP